MPDGGTPEGPAREAALLELREIATINGKPQTDLLAEAAGIQLGTADGKGPPEGLHHAICGELLVEAGAGPPELIEQWRHERARLEAELARSERVLAEIDAANRGTHLEEK